MPCIFKNKKCWTKNNKYEIVREQCHQNVKIKTQVADKDTVQKLCLNSTS